MLLSGRVISATVSGRAARCCSSVGAPTAKPPRRLRHDPPFKAAIWRRAGGLLYMGLFVGVGGASLTVAGRTAAADEGSTETLDSRAPWWGGLVAAVLFRSACRGTRALRCRRPKSGGPECGRAGLELLWVAVLAAAVALRLGSSPSQATNPALVGLRHPCALDGHPALRWPERTCGRRRAQLGPASRFF